MSAMIIGAVLALIFIGLPSGIIWLFIASILDRRNIKAVDGRRRETGSIEELHFRRQASQPEGATLLHRTRVAARSLVLAGAPDRRSDKNPAS